MDLVKDWKYIVLSLMEYLTIHTSIQKNAMKDQ